MLLCNNAIMNWERGREEARKKAVITNNKKREKRKPTKSHTVRVCTGVFVVVFFFSFLPTFHFWFNLFLLNICPPLILIWLWEKEEKRQKTTIITKEMMEASTIPEAPEFIVSKKGRNRPNSRKALIIPHDAKLISFSFLSFVIVVRQSENAPFYLFLCKKITTISLYSYITFSYEIQNYVIQ